MISDTSDASRFLRWDIPVKINVIRKNVLYKKIGNNDNGYYVIGNNVATVCNGDGGAVFMTGVYTKWISFGGQCNVTVGTNDTTPTRCDRPENASFVFMVEDAEGWIRNWTGFYFPCNFIQDIRIETSMRAVDGFIHTFSRWNFFQGLMMSRSNERTFSGIRNGACSFRVCFDEYGRSFPEYIVDGFMCVHDDDQKIQIRVYSFPYYSMIMGVGLKCLMIM